MIIPLVSSAEAIEPYTIQGGFDGGSIVILFDGADNAITLNYEGITSYHYDGKLKTYNSGGFVIKNLESGIVVFGHSIGNEQYRLVLLTDGNIHRLIGVSGFTQIVIPSYKEPVSSIGADITKYDIPDTLDRDSGKETFLMAFKSTQTLDTLRLNEEFDFNGVVWSVRNNTGIKDVDITLEIIRDDYILKSVKLKSGTGGLIRVELGELTYPLFYPKFCYDVNVTMDYGNYTQTWTGDFVMEYAFGTVTWEPNMNWTSESRWNYLPQVFSDEPRVSIYADAHCN